MESDDPPRWRFWDFGSVQFVQDTLSGESLHAHGQGAAFTDGPFRFVRIMKTWRRIGTRNMHGKRIVPTKGRAIMRVATAYEPMARIGV